MTPQGHFIEFCRLRTRKGKALPTSPFLCRMLVRQHQEGSNVAPYISGVGYIECTLDSVTTLHTLKTEDAVAEHNNGNKTIFLKSANYRSCMAWAVYVSPHRGEDDIRQETLLFVLQKSLDKTGN